MASSDLEQIDVEVQPTEELLHELDKGLDDIEAGRFLPVDEAFERIERLCMERRNARLRGSGIARSSG